MQRHFTRSVLGVFVLLLSLWNTAQADLVAHWQFENNPNDASGNGLNGVPHGSATYVADGRITKIMIYDQQPALRVSRLDPRRLEVIYA